MAKPIDIWNKDASGNCTPCEPCNPCKPPNITINNVCGGNGSGGSGNGNGGGGNGDGNNNGGSLTDCEGNKVGTKAVVTCEEFARAIREQLVTKEEYNANLEAIKKRLDELEFKYDNLQKQVEDCCKGGGKADPCATIDQDIADEVDKIVRTLVDNTEKFLRGFFQLPQFVINTILKTARKVLTFIVNLAKKPAEFFKTVFEFITGKLKGLVDKLVAWLKDKAGVPGSIAEIINKVITKVVGKFIDFATNALNTIIGFFNGSKNTIVGGIEKLITKVLDGIISLADKVNELINKGISGGINKGLDLLQKALEQIGKFFQGSIQEAIDTLRKVIENNKGSFGELIIEVVTKLVDLLPLPSFVKKVLKEGLAKTIQPIIDALKKPKDFIKNLINKNADLILGYAEKWNDRGPKGKDDSRLDKLIDKIGNFVMAFVPANARKIVLNTVKDLSHTNIALIIKTARAIQKAGNKLDLVDIVLKLFMKPIEVIDKAIKDFIEKLKGADGKPIGGIINAAKKVLLWILDQAQKALDGVAGLEGAAKIVGKIKDFLSGFKLPNIIEKFIKPLKEWVTKIANKFKDLNIPKLEPGKFKEWLNAILAKRVEIIKRIVELIKPVAEFIAKWIDKGIKFLQGLWTKGWDFFEKTVNKVLDFIENVTKKPEILDNILKAGRAFGYRVAEKVANVAEALMAFVPCFLKKWILKVKKLVTAVLELLGLFAKGAGRLARLGLILAEILTVLAIIATIIFLAVTAFIIFNIILGLIIGAIALTIATVVGLTIAAIAGFILLVTSIIASAIVLGAIIIGASLIGAAILGAILFSALTLGGIVLGHLLFYGTLFFIFVVIPAMIIGSIILGILGTIGLVITGVVITIILDGLTFILAIITGTIGLGIISLIIGGLILGALTLGALTIGGLILAAMVATPFIIGGLIIGGLILGALGLGATGLTIGALILGALLLSPFIIGGLLLGGLGLLLVGGALLDIPVRIIAFIVGLIGVILNGLIGAGVGFVWAVWEAPIHIAFPFGPGVSAVVHEVFGAVIDVLFFIAIGFEILLILTVFVPIPYFGWVALIINGAATFLGVPFAISWGVIHLLVGLLI